MQGMGGHIVKRYKPLPAQAEGGKEDSGKEEEGKKKGAVTEDQAQHSSDASTSKQLQEELQQTKDKGDKGKQADSKAQGKKTTKTKKTKKGKGKKKNSEERTSAAAGDGSSDSGLSAFAQRILASKGRSAVAVAAQQQQQQQQHGDEEEKEKGKEGEKEKGKKQQAGGASDNGEEEEREDEDILEGFKEKYYTKKFQTRVSDRGFIQDLATAYLEGVCVCDLLPQGFGIQHKPSLQFTYILNHTHTRTLICWLPASTSLVSCACRGLLGVAVLLPGVPVLVVVLQIPLRTLLLRL